MLTILSENNANKQEKKNASNMAIEFRTTKHLK